MNLVDKGRGLHPSNLPIANRRLLPQIAFYFNLMVDDDQQNLNADLTFLASLGVSKATDYAAMQESFDTQAQNTLKQQAASKTAARKERLLTMRVDFQRKLDRARSPKVLQEVLQKLAEVEAELEAIEEDAARNVTDINAEEKEKVIVDLPSKPSLNLINKTKKSVKEASKELQEETSITQETIEDQSTSEDEEVIKEVIKDDWSDVNNENNTKGWGDVPMTFIHDEISLPSSLWVNDLLPYQRTGIEWLVKHWLAGTGGILADEMGLGKTCQALLAMAATRTSQRHSVELPVLVVCPATVMRQWIGEARKWWPQSRIILAHASGPAFVNGMSADRLQHVLDRTEQFDLIVTSYGTLCAYDEQFSGAFSAVFLDEGHKIRNPQTEVARVAHNTQTPAPNLCPRFILSGTPLQNGLHDLWSLVHFVRPGLLGPTPALFHAEFVAPIAAGGYAHASHFQVRLAYKCSLALKHLLAPLMLRRSKLQVAQELPPKREQVLFCRLSGYQRELYVKVLQDESIQACISGERNVLAGIDILRKICNHPNLLMSTTSDTLDWVRLKRIASIEDHCEASVKLRVLKGLLEAWIPQGHRTLIFCQTRQMLDVVESFLRQLFAQSPFSKCAFLRMDGTTAIGMRPRLIDTFNSNAHYAVFLLTTRVGGLGVNLTGADRVIIVDPDWNPATDLQARERVWRLGQHRPVTIYRLVTVGTIEEKIYQRQLFKHFLTSHILNDPKQARYFFKAGDLHDLFTLTDHDTSDGKNHQFEHILEKDRNETFNLGQGVTETADLFAGQQESVFGEDPMLDTMLRGVQGLHSAIRHDLLTERPAFETKLVEHEADRMANSALKSLQTSAFHQPSKPINKNNPSSTSNVKEWGERLFRSFRAQPDMVIPSDQLVRMFGMAVQDAVQFRALLRKLATFDSVTRKWHLRERFRKM